MQDLTREALIARIEGAIAGGRFAEARSALAEAVDRFGRAPVLDELRRRVDEVEKIALEPQFEALVRQAQEEIRKADYPSALGALKRALGLCPDDPEARVLLAETEKAARRHRQAIERDQAIDRRAREIGELLSRGELAAGRAELEQAGIEHGRHRALNELWQRLEGLEVEARRRRKLEVLERARSLFSAGNLGGAREEAERALRLDPGNPEAREIADKARSSLEREAGRRYHQRAVEAARTDVERLIAAGELPRASRHLRQAIDELGREAVFDELLKRLDKARDDLQFRQRIEWAERRANEAAGLIAEAALLSLKGAYGEAVERLEAARRLDPSHPEIGDRLATATTARDRQIAERQRAEARYARVAEIRSLLDALRLDAAAAALGRALAADADDPRLAALRTRLERLRQAETAGAGEGAGVAEPESESALRSQRALAAAYSWKQTFLFPFRGRGPAVFWGGLALLLLLDLLSLLPTAGAAFAVLRRLVPLAAGAFVLAVVRATVEGRNHLPAWEELAGGRRWPADLASALALAAAALAPVALWVAARRGSADGGTLTWLLAVPLAWLASAGIVLAWGAAGAFGRSRGWRFDRHLKALAGGGVDAQIAIGVLFTLAVIHVLARLIFQGTAPWLGAIVTAAAEVYALLLAPHLIGVVVRRHRVEWAGVYGRR